MATVAPLSMPVPAAKASLARGASLVLQGLLLLILAQGFHLESPAFYRQVLPLMLGGAVVHHLLPARYRTRCFAALSMASVVLVFGPGAGGWLLALGLLLIGLCHVPVAWRVRLALVAGAGAGLMAMRGGWLPTVWPGVIWPVLGSMFMFRLAIYLYDLKHFGPAEPGLVLGYFFLAPNVVFPFFPVVDFHTFRRTYYDRPAFEIYAEGLRWIARGFTHLVLYRVIYQHVALPPSEVDSTARLVQYLVANYGLYLRVSGQFHVIVGLLHLFGFRLPETHRFFYLASSFTDLWRRINIYWKDFMQKLVYLPVFFGLKGRGETAALVTATVTVVAATWALHAYQWFWLLGEWLLSATDIAFWGAIGLCLLAAVLREHRRAQLPAPKTLGPGQAWRHAAQTATMFAVMSVLWGFWTSATLEESRALLRATTLRWIDIAVVAGTLATVALAAFVVRRFGLDAAPGPRVRRAWPVRHWAAVALPVTLFWLVAQPPPIGMQLLYSQIAPVLGPSPPPLLLWLHGKERELELEVHSRLPVRLREMARDARIDQLNRYDAERQQRGYYERLIAINRLDGRLWERYARGGPDDWVRLGELGIMMPRRDPLQTQLVPLAAAVVHGSAFTTNQWGMRDRDYDAPRSPSTRRLAVLGQSYVLGVGVGDGQTFEALIEDRLNREWPPRTQLRYESLNFAVPNYSLAQDALLLENGRVRAFQPDVVIVIGNGFDPRQLTDYLLEELQEGRIAEQPEAARFVAESGLQPQMSNLEANRRLRPYHEALARWAFQRMASAVGPDTVLVYALIPLPGDRVDPAIKTRLFDAARSSSFRVIDLERVFDGMEPSGLHVSTTDFHPNAKGHTVIADRLYDELIKVEGLLTPTASVR